LAVAGADIADVDAFALEILEAVDVGIHCGNQVNRFGMDGENSPQVLLGAFVFPVFDPHDGLVLPIGLRDAEFEVTGQNGIDVEHGSAGGLHRGTDAVLLALFVDHLGDCAAGGIVYTRNAARADGDKGGFSVRRLLKRSEAGEEGEAEYEGCCHDDKFFHVILL